MTYLLVFIIVVLCCAIVWLSISFRQSRLSHRRHLYELRLTIAALDAANREQTRQLMLYEELKAAMRGARTTLDSKLLEAQSDFISALYKNNLLD